MLQIRIIIQAFLLQIRITNLLKSCKYALQVWQNMQICNNPLDMHVENNIKLK